MKAAVIITGEPHNRLEIQDVPAPQPGPQDVLVAVKAVGLNRVDLLLRAQHLRNVGGAPTAAVAGLEIAGEVSFVGPEVTGVKIGDRVMAMASQAYAEVARADHRILMPVPAGLNWTEAAALPVALMTAHNALVTAGAHVRGESVLVQAASTAVGIAVLQIAKMRGARTFGTSGTPSKLDALKAFGLDVGIAASAAGIAPRIAEETDGRGVDVLIDHIGGPALADNMACLANGGRLVSVGRMAGYHGPLDMDQLSLKRLSLVGVTFRTRSALQIQALIAAMVADLWDDVTAKRIRMPVDKVYPLGEAAAAQAHMRANAHLGKIILEV